MRRTSSRSTGSRTFYFSPLARLSFLRVFIIFMFLILGVRLVYVQAVLRGDLQRKAQRQNPIKDTTQPQRGLILDRNGAILAETVPALSCYVDPTMLLDKRSAALKLASILGLNSASLEKKIRATKGSFLWVSRNVPAHFVEKIRTENIRGVAFKTEYRRHYPHGTLASHLLGVVGHEGRGLSGVEQAYEKTLSISPHALDQHGNVQLTIDSEIQAIVEKELYWGVNKTGAKRGMAIVQDPWTGEILASASWPALSMDPDNPPDPKEMRIPELVDVFEPGSTFKIVLAAAAIGENLVKHGERFGGEKGAWKISSVTIHDHEPHTQMSFDEIMMYSSNIGVAKIAERLGNDRLYQYARLFGFGVFPGSGLACEAKGVLRSPSQWSGVSKYIVSFGQEVGVTAMQMVGAYSVLANGGQLMEPKLVKSILDRDGKIQWEVSPSVVRRVVDSSTAKELTRMLTRVVNEGTGQNARIRTRPGIEVAGKTGTAQKFSLVDKRYHPELTLVSFSGYFPVQSPRFTMMVILDEPEGRRWGGADAAPVFQRIAEQLVPRLSGSMNSQS